MAELVVSEVFGPTFQGEGPSLGRRAGFVRLGRCNLACTFCDTPYTWDWERFDPATELTHRSVDDVAAAIEAMDVHLVVVTGGEPLLQQSRLVELLARLAPRAIEIETAGTLAPSPELVALVTRFNVSPKLAGSGNERDRRYRPDALRAMAGTGKAVWKFVVAEPGDVEEIQSMVGELGLAAEEVWVMAEGTETTTLLARQRDLADIALARGWNLTTRLHVLVWGDERGR